MGRKAWAISSQTEGITKVRNNASTTVIGSFVYFHRNAVLITVYYKYAVRHNSFNSINALPAEIQMCRFMGTAPINNDNIYPVGTFITAREFPARKLLINAYMQRIYYCSTVDRPEATQLVYFERELIQPA